MLASRTCWPRRRRCGAEPLLGPVDLTSIADDGFSAVDSLRAYTVAQAREDWGAGFDEECGLQADQPALDWIIVGGESGPGARPMHPDWARGLRHQCQAAGVPFFFKQWGEWAPSTQDEATGNPRSGWKSLLGYPAVPSAEDLLPSAGAAFMEHKGKTRAGRLLDGRAWDEMPETSG